MEEEAYATTRFEGKIETFDPSIVDIQERLEIPQNVITHSQEEVHLENSQESHEEAAMQEETDAAMQLVQAEASPHQNLTLTPVRLPAILDGEFFSVIRVDDSNVTVRCIQCSKLLNGNLKSTGNFLSHIKRVHPYMLDKIKCKSNQRKPAVAYIDLSVEKSSEIVRTKRGYRKCYKLDDSQTSQEDCNESSTNNWSECPIRRRKSDEQESTDHTKFPQNNSYLMEDEFDAIGRNVAAKLRNMRLDQRIIAEKLLNDVLFEAQLGTLLRDSSLQV